jgi:hypothetical protein
LFAQFGFGGARLLGGERGRDEEQGEWEGKDGEASAKEGDRDHGVSRWWR